MFVEPRRPGAQRVRRDILQDGANDGTLRERGRPRALRERLPSGREPSGFSQADEADSRAAADNQANCFSTTESIPTESPVWP